MEHFHKKEKFQTFIKIRNFYEYIEGDRKAQLQFKTIWLQ